MFQRVSIFLFMLVSLVIADMIQPVNSATKTLNDYTLVTEDATTGLIIDHLTVDAMIAIWGYNHWRWGDDSLHTRREDWFEQDSDTGGSDKTGHFYMTYLLSRVMASRMEDRGYSLEEASLAGALSGMLAMTLLEVGDGTSPYGFSNEDLLADALGAGLAYLVRSNPKVDDFVDIRLEYMPTSGYLKGGDNTTDYSGMKHLVALKLGGFESLKDTYWSLIEFQAGYYARGYRSFDTIAPSQHSYVGIGLSLANLAQRSEINILKNLFEIYQPGGTYLETDIWSR
ncbi:MAG: DUF2279 domain-containing protein [Campylobacterota bacterium]|nr:DUF2279 domain-containing protein [Campylobacterota bacterium]